MFTDSLRYWMQLFTHNQPDQTGSKNKRMVFGYVLLLALFLLTDELYHDKEYLSIAFADRHILHKIKEKPTKYRREFLLHRDTKRGHQHVRIQWKRPSLGTNKLIHFYYDLSSTFFMTLV